MRDSEPSDPELLAEWLRDRREGAFRQLVARYAGMVHAAARRTSGDETIAAEVSQAVFILLARNARSLTTRASLAGWLHVTAVMQAKNLARKNRREIRKRELLHADMETNANHEAAAKWRDLQPVLDDAMAALPEKDREVLLLFFYRALNFQEVGETLGIAREAARKRIERATEKLRVKLALKGLDAGGSLSSVMLAGFAVDGSVAGLPVSIISMKATAVAPAGLSIWIPTTIAMKGITMVPPVAALIIAGLWIGSRRDAVAALEAGNRSLAGALAAGGSGKGPSAAGGDRKTAGGFSNGRGGVNWEAVSAAAADRKRLGVWGAIDSMNDVKLGQILSKMSPEDALAQLDVIAELPVSSEIKEELEQAILLPLAWKHPGLVLERLADRLPGSSMLRHFMILSLNNLAKEDPGQAERWLDEQIAAGRFTGKRLDGIDHTRLAFEAVVVMRALSGDPEMVERRMAALTPGEMRAFFMNLSNGGPSLSEAGQAGLIALAREHLPEAGRAEVIAWQAESMAPDLEKAAAFLDRAELPPGARSEAVILTGARNIVGVSCNRRVTPADLDAMRAWVARQAPAELGRATGRALADACERGIKMGFSDAVELATHYRDADDGDDVLATFLGSGIAAKNKEKAREIAASIRDEGKRNTVLEVLR